MLKKIFLLFLVSFHICNGSHVAENVPLKVEAVVSLKRISLLVCCALVVTIIFRKVIAHLYPSNDCSYSSFEKKLMLNNDQKFFGEIPESIREIISLLKVVPSVQPASYFSSLFSNSVGIDPNLHKLLPKSYIIHGPPGHGKNFVIQEMKNILAQDRNDPANKEIPFMLINGDLNTKYVGGAAHNWKETIDALKQYIRKSPKKIGFLVIDECEKLFYSRSKDSFVGSVVTHILSTIDGFNTDLDLKIIVIGLTNRFKDIDEGIISRAHTIYYTQLKENLTKINNSKLDALGIKNEVLAEFFQHGGRVCKLNISKEPYYDKTLTYDINPRDLDWISSQIFVQWASEQKQDNNKTQSQLVKEFGECAGKKKNDYFDQAFSIDWKVIPPVLYSKNIK